MAPRESCTCKPHGCLADGRLWALEEAHTLLQKPQGFPSLLLQLSEEVPSSAKPQKQQQDHQMLCPHPPGQVQHQEDEQVEDLVLQGEDEGPPPDLG